MSEDARSPEIARFDVHVGVAGVKLIKRGGPHHRLPFRLLTVDVLYTGDDLFHIRDLGDLLFPEYLDCCHDSLPFFVNF